MKNEDLFFFLQKCIPRKPFVSQKTFCTPKKSFGIQRKTCIPTPLTMPEIFLYPKYKTFYIPKNGIPEKCIPEKLLVFTRKKPLYLNAPFGEIRFDGWGVRGFCFCFFRFFPSTSEAVKSEPNLNVCVGVSRNVVHFNQVPNQLSGALHQVVKQRLHKCEKRKNKKETERKRGLKELPNP